MSQNPLIVVIYDGIENSVFQGQVLTPLLERQKKDPQQGIILISFERSFSVCAEPLKPLLDLGGTVLILKRLPFLGKISLYHSAYQLRSALKPYKNYHLLTRSPLAGWVALKAVNTKFCHSFVMQARGLLAQEYAYTHPQGTSWIKNRWHQWRENALEQIEQELYKAQKNVSYTIEAVSETLRDYLVTHYQADQKQITIAHADIPQLLDAQQKMVWRQEIRQQLGIAEYTKVYCYSGSVKAWQCPDMTVDFFNKQLQEDPNSFLLIMTPDREPFHRLLEQAQIDQKNYYICSVDHQEIYRYLAACDVGIIFRTACPVNWVSRPTKIVEYRAVGLEIVHNNTIGLLHQKHFSGTYFLTQ